MISQQSLLELLADGQWHSGEALGEAFDVSRAAIWKQLKPLQLSGLEIESERGKGYRLQYPVQLLNAQNIFIGLSSPASQLLSKLDIQFSIDSTNTHATRLITEKAEQAAEDLTGTAIFAEQQTAGRGRRGKAWVSPLASNIYGSIIWRFNAGAASLSGLSLAVGVAIVDALESQGFCGIELKWPNDLLWRGRKLGGILLEMSGDADGPCDIVVGIGLNLTMSQYRQHQTSGVSDIDQAWVDLLEIASSESAGRLPEKNALVSAMLNYLLPMLSTFEHQGFAAHLDAWSKHDAFNGREVVLHLGDNRIIGRYAGVDRDGALLLDTEDGQKSFNGGEVSLRVSQE